MLAEDKGIDLSNAPRDAWLGSSTDGYGPVEHRGSGIPACMRLQGVGSAGSASRFGSETRLELPLASSQPLVQLQSGRGFTPLSQRTFPDDCDPPTCFEQVASVPPIPFDIGIKLGLPELLASGRGVGVGAVVVSMPETAMNEAYRSEPPKHEVRRAGEFAIVQSVSETEGVKSTSKEEFGPRVPVSDSGHHARTGRSVHYVRHRRSCGRLEEFLRQQISRENSNLIKAGGRSGRGSVEILSAVRLRCQVRADDGSGSRRPPRMSGTKSSLPGCCGLLLSVVSFGSGS